MNNININEVILTGRIVTKFKFDHEVFGEKFYTFTLKSRRLSGVCDYLPIKISEKLINVERNYIGRYVEIIGQFRSLNKWENSKNKLIMNVFVKGIYFCKEQQMDINRIHMDGYICGKPTYRETPLGREISDLMIAVNRRYNKSAYIPTITWGKSARFAGTLQVGDKVELVGRIQSREYLKILDDGNSETRTAYEVSASIITLIE